MKYIMRFVATCLFVAPLVLMYTYALYGFEVYSVNGFMTMNIIFLVIGGAMSVALLENEESNE